MKTRIIYTSFFALAVFLIFSGYKEGPALNSGWDCTGAESNFQNPQGCATGGGCHASNATAGITVALELDSAGTPVTSYKGGQNYTVKLTGTNTTTSNLPAFGFQIASIVGSASLPTPTNAGTWGAPPASTHISTPVAQEFVLNIVEQSKALSPTTGSGGTNTTYAESFTWTAPATGTGTVSIWAALNAVNGNGKADAGDLWNTNQLVITEDTLTAVATGISALHQTDEIRLFPNPVTAQLNLQWQNLQAGTYKISVFSMNGQLVDGPIAGMNESGNVQSINTTGWAPGVYLVSLERNNARSVYRVVKE